MYHRLKAMFCIHFRIILLPNYCRKMSGRGCKRHIRREYSPNQRKRDKSHKPNHPPHLKGREIGLFYRRQARKNQPNVKIVSIYFFLKSLLTHEVYFSNIKMEYVSETFSASLKKWVRD